MNILHLFTDQQRFDTVSAIGKPWMRTPNLDRLVREGVSYSQAFSPSPECVPARACMITGMYPGRTGCFSNTECMPSPEEVPSFMQLLSDAGYRTHGVGKCHFTPDSHALRGFQTRDSQEELPKDRLSDDYQAHLVEQGYDWLLEPHGVRGEMYYVPQPSALPESLHPSHWVADHSIDFISQTDDGTQPWYLYSSFVHPHPPFAPPAPWHKLYRAPDMPLPDLPDDCDSILCHINRLQNRYKYRDRGGLDINLVRCLWAYYAACISFVDAQIGRILSALEESGQLDNTMILFSADHGEYLGDFGCFGKRGMHDVSARIPLIIRWPDGHGAGTHCHTPASLIDIAPTFLQAANVDEPSQAMDGVSLLDLADGRNKRERVFSQYNHGASGLYMTVEKDWKYIYSAADQKEYLFDRKNDPLEHSNLAMTSLAPDALPRLRQECLSWVRGTGQTDALSSQGGWRSYPVQTMPDAPDAGLIFQDPVWWDGRLPNW